jgi:hypothetical protein
VVRVEAALNSRTQNSSNRYHSHRPKCNQNPRFQKLLSHEQFIASEAPFIASD